MRACLVVLSCLCLQGCWFIFIPGSLFASGNTCVAESAYVGQRVHNRYNGKTGTLKEMHGRSERCQSGELPIVATVEYD
jgi:hypothetical protein